MLDCVGLVQTAVKRDKLVIRYILFAFSPDPQQEGTDLVAALILFTAATGEQTLKVYTRPQWDQKYEPGESLQLAKEILADWELVDPEESEFIFNDLLDASMGPLQVKSSGSCTQNEIGRLLAKELQVEVLSDAID